MVAVVGDWHSGLVLGVRWATVVEGEIERRVGEEMSDSGGLGKTDRVEVGSGSCSSGFRTLHIDIRCNDGTVLFGCEEPIVAKSMSSKRI